jgi:HK97 family phage major capsid protein
MEKFELVSRAYDANAFTTDDTAAGYINPTYWDGQLFDHIRANLVMLPLGQDVTARFPDNGGSTFNLTILAEPAMASAVAESVALSVAAYAPTQAQLTPSEIGLALQVSDKELRRAFYDVMSDMVRYLGYSIAKAIDEQLLDTVTSGAGNAVTANGVVSSAIASSDTLDHADVLNAMEENAADSSTTTSRWCSTRDSTAT